MVGISVAVARVGASVVSLFEWVRRLFVATPLPLDERREEAWRGILRRHLELDQMMQYYRSRGGGLRGACIQLRAAGEEIERLRAEAVWLRRQLEGQGAAGILESKRR